MHRLFSCQMSISCCFLRRKGFSLTLCANHSASLSETQVVHALGSKISLVLVAAGGLPLALSTVKSESVPLTQALITSKGVVLGAKDSYAGKALKFIFHQSLGFPVRTLPIFVCLLAALTVLLRLRLFMN